jgi:cold shock CspA family protein
MKGKISQWHDDKGYGFIVSDDGAEKVFFHISSLKTSSRRPQIGDSVVYESTLDAKQRLQAKAVVIEGLVAQPAPQRKSQPIQIAPPRKNAFDYLLILILLGCLGKVGWDFYHTRLLNEAMAPFAIAVELPFWFSIGKRNRNRSSLVAPGVRLSPILILELSKPGTMVF